MSSLRQAPFLGRRAVAAIAGLALVTGLVIVFDASAPWRRRGTQPDVDAANIVATAATAAGLHDGGV